MNLKEFVELVTSMLTSAGFNQGEIFTQDIVDEINLIAPVVRLSDIKGGNDERYAIEKSFVFSTDSHLNPNIKQANITPAPENSLDPPKAIIRSVAYTTNNQIKNTTQTFDEGDYARIDSKLYIAVTAFNDLNTKDKTFKSEDIQFFVPNKTYKVGDVVYDIENHVYYRVINEFISDPEISAHLDDLDQLFWMFVGTAYVEPYYTKFRELRVSQVNPFTFTFLGNKIYVSKDIFTLHLWYIPEWVELTEPDEKLNLGSTATNELREAVFNSVRRKLANQPEPKSETQDGEQ